MLIITTHLESQLEAEYLDMDEKVAQINAGVRMQEEIVVELFRSKPGGVDYGVSIWPSSEIKSNTAGITMWIQSINQ